MATTPEKTMLQVLQEEIGVQYDGIEDIKCGLEIRNLGGIDVCNVDFEAGVTLLRGSNASNRSSFLQALNGVLGGSKVRLRTDTDEGGVKFTVRDEVIASRQYERMRSGTEVTGEGLYNDPIKVDTFATLIEGNAVREAVKSGSGEAVREVLMSPVDVEEIQRKIRQLTDERDEIDAELRQIENQLENGPQLSAKQESLKAEIEELETQIRQTRADIEIQEEEAELDDDTESAIEELETNREQLKTLKNKREVLQAELGGVKADRQNLRDSIDELADKLDSVEGETPELTYQNLVAGNVSTEELGSVNGKNFEREISRLRGERDRLKQTVSELTRVRQFNDSLVDGESEVLMHFTEVDPTAKLDPNSQEVTCPTCSSVVTKSAIRKQNAELASLVENKRDELSRIEKQLSDLEEQRNQIEELQSQFESYASRVSALENEIPELEATLEELDKDIRAVDREVREWENTVDEMMEDHETKAGSEGTEIIDLTDELNNLEFERGQKEKELESVTEQLMELEKQRERKEELEETREETKNEITTLRERIDTLENSIIDLFNSHMETVLDIIGAENIARVWIEKRKPDIADSPVKMSEFELHVVREGEKGAYEDTIDTLSESEREIIGLTAALAGYLTHDLDETIPFILLDSIEAIDGQRLADLVDYFSDHSLFLFIAILPRYEDAFPDTYKAIVADEAFV